MARSAESRPSVWSHLRAEARPMLALAGPVVLAELGWMAMGSIDLVMVGPLGAEAIGAVGIANILFFFVFILGYGVLLGLDPLVSQAFGARAMDDCHRSLVQGVYLALAMAPVLMGLMWLGIPVLGWLGIQPPVLRLAIPYLQVLSLGVPPLLAMHTFRRYLQGMGLVKPIMVALVSANVVNLAGNWILIWGKLGFPAIGLAGSAWATDLARVYLALFLIGCAWRHDRRHNLGLRRVDLAIDWALLRRLIGLGLPAAGHILLEMGVFALATVLIGRLMPAALAAHEIVLNVCSLTFMVPLGVSSAGSVRVGQAIGREDPAAAVRAGWTALCVGGGFMSCAGLSFILAPHSILGVFTNDRAVLTIGVPLLGIAAVFQLFDGVQVVATGLLRGLGDTRTPMYACLVGYWALGLPVGYVLGFAKGWGVYGIWVGISAGLIAVGVVLMTAWLMRANGLRHGCVPDRLATASES